MPDTVGFRISHGRVHPKRHIQSPFRPARAKLCKRPRSLDVMAYVVAVLPRRESGCRPLAGIDTQPRTLDVLVIDDPLAVAGRDVVAARVVRNFDDFPEELVRLLLARARVLVAKVVG